MSALQFAASLDLIPPLPSALTSRLLTASRNLAAPRAAPPCIRPSSLAHAATRASTPALRHILSLAMVSWFFLLRISEALRLAPAHVSADFSSVTVAPSKNHARPLPVPAPPGADVWLRALVSASETPPNIPFFGGRPKDLNAGLRDLLSGTPDADATWHGLRRGRATFLFHQGVPLADIALQGRWTSREVRTYVHPFQP